MGQGHVAGAGPIEFAQQGQGIVDRITALHPDQAGDPARREDGVHLVGGLGQTEGLGMGGDDPLGRVDLFERLLDRLARRQAGRHIDRPELTADAAGPQSCDVGVQLGGRRQILGQINGVDIVSILLSQRPWQVVVPVDQRRRLQDAQHPRLVCILSLGRSRQGKGGDSDEEKTTDHGRAS